MFESFVLAGHQVESELFSVWRFGRGPTRLVWISTPALKPTSGGEPMA